MVYDLAVRRELIQLGRDIAAMAAKVEVGVDDGSPIQTSFPIFEGLMKSLGAEIARS